MSNIIENEIEVKSPSQSAFALWQLGCSLIPLESNSKLPLVSWKNAIRHQISMDQVGGFLPRQKTWALLTGRQPEPRCQSPCGIGVVVVDADDKEHEQWCLDNLPATPLTVKTRQGSHYYYRHPGYHVGNRNLRTSGLRIDVKADGAYVVAPGSRVKDHTYIASQPITAELLASLPVYDPTWFPVAPEPVKPPTQQIVAVETSNDERIEQARAYLSARPGSQAGKGADGYVFALAMALVHGYQLDRDVAIELLSAWGQGESNQDALGSYYPWSGGEISHKIDDAIDTEYRGQPGDLIQDTTDYIAKVAEVIKPYENNVSQDEEEDPHYGLGDRFGKNRQPAIVQNMILQNSLCTIFGPSGCRKTWYCLQMALSIATGKDFLGQFPVKQGKVYYVISEGEDSFEDRAFTWMIENGFDFRDPIIAKQLRENFVYFASAYDFSNPDGLPEVMKNIKRTIGSPDIIFIDTLSQNASGDTEKNGDAKVVMQNLKKLNRATGATVVQIHHTGHQNEDREIGGVSLRHMIDTSIQIKVDDNGHKLGGRVLCRKQRGRPAFRQFRVDWTNRQTDVLDGDGHYLTGLIGSYADYAEEQAEQDNANERKIIDCVINNPGLSKGDVVKSARSITGMGRDTATQLIADMIAAGQLIERQGAGASKTIFVSSEVIF